MPIVQNTTYRSSSFLRPKDDIDPRKKVNDKSWSLDYAKFIYSQFMSQNCAIKPEDATRLERNRSYAEGRQDTSVYKNWILGNDSDESKPNIPTSSPTAASKRLIDSLAEDNIGISNINFDDVFSPLPKYIETVIGIMRGQQHDIEVSAIDEKSGSIKEDLKYGSLVKSQLKAVLASFSAVFDLPQEEQDQVLPESIHDLELFDNIGAFKLAYEIAMEKMISHTEEISEIDTIIKDHAVEDLMVDGFFGMLSFQDPITGKTVHERKDVLDIILEDSSYEDYKDATYGGVVEYFSIHKIREITGWKEEKVEKVAEQYHGSQGLSGEFNNSRNASNQYNYDDYKIPTLHCYWKSIDTEYYSERETKNGPVRFHEAYKKNGAPPKKQGRRDLDKGDIRRLYETYWIIDSDEIFSNGIVTNTPYNFGMKDVEFPISLIKTKGKKPKIESMIPIEDQIYLTFIKTQNAIAKAAPPGLAIELGAIENVTYNNKKLKPKHVITIYTNSGNLIYKGSNAAVPGQWKNGTSGAPIQQLQGGLGTAITEGINGIEFLYRQLDVVTGIDGITSSTSAPSRETGKAVSEMALASTSNTIKHIYNSFIRMKEKAAKISAWTGQAILSAYEDDELQDCPYYNALGYANLIAIKTAGGNTPPDYGFSMVARSNDVEKANILEAAKAALAGGKNGIPALTYSEYSFIVRYLGSGKSVKYLEVYIAKKEQERTAKEKQVAEDNMRIQAEENRKSKESEHALKMEEIQIQNQINESEARAKAAAEAEKEIQVERVKGQETRLTEEVKHKNAMAQLAVQSINNSNNQN